MRPASLAKLLVSICLGVLGAASRSHPGECIGSAQTTVSNVGETVPCGVGESPASRGTGEYGEDGADDSASGYGYGGKRSDNELGSGGALGSYGNSVADAPVEPQSRPAGGPAEPLNACTECQTIYAQCGGGDFTESVCCEVGLSCVKKNVFYGQCLPPTRAKRNILNGWDGTVVACGSSDAFDQGDVSRARNPRD